MSSQRIEAELLQIEEAFMCVSVADDGEKTLTLEEVFDRGEFMVVDELGRLRLDHRREALMILSRLVAFAEDSEVEYRLRHVIYQLGRVLCRLVFNKKHREMSDLSVPNDLSLELLLRTLLDADPMDLEELKDVRTRIKDTVSSKRHEEPLPLRVPVLSGGHR
jgi:hypothetical protein